MRSFVLLSILGLAAGESRMAEQGVCAVDGAEAVSDLMDSSMFIWAAIARCGHAGEQVKCEVNTASAIESLYSMINVILKAVDQCGDLKTHHPACGLAASKFAQNLAGLTAASGGVAEKCTTKGQAAAAHGTNWAYAKEAQCVVNLKDTAKSLFKVIASLLRVKKNCKDQGSNACTSNALQIVAAFAGMGEYLAGTVGQCSAGKNLNTECSEEVSSLVHHLTKVAQDGVDMSKACQADLVLVFPIDQEVPRLYSNDDKAAKGSNDGKDQAFVANLVLGGFLPVTAFASFVVGKIFGERRSRMTETREFMSDHE